MSVVPCLQGKVAYVPQQAWIQNATVRENICFGQRYDPSLFKKVRVFVLPSALYAAVARWLHESNLGFIAIVF